MFNLYTVYQPVTHSCSYGPSYISYKYIKKKKKHLSHPIYGMFFYPIEIPNSTHL